MVISCGAIQLLIHDIESWVVSILPVSGQSAGNLSQVCARKVTSCVSKPTKKIVRFISWVYNNDIKNHIFTNSTLLLFAFPSSVLLSLMGFVSPYPFVVSLDASTP